MDTHIITNAKEKKTRQQKTTKEQQDAYLSYLEMNREFATGKFDASKPTYKDQKWSELTTILNTCGPPVRSTENWKKIMSSWRNQVKSKARLKRVEVTGTGGGPQRVPKLSEMEERALDVWGRIVVDGDVNITTIGIENEENECVNECVNECSNECDDIFGNCLSVEQIVQNHQPSPSAVQSPPPKKKKTQDSALSILSVELKESLAKRTEIDIKNANSFEKMASGFESMGKALLLLAEKFK